MTGTYVKFADMPAWAKEAIKQHLPGRRPRCEIVYTTHPSFGPVWHDACRRYLVARRPDGETLSVVSANYDSLLASSKVEQLVYFGGETELPPGGAILEILTYPPSATLYLHPTEAAKALPEQVELAPRQLKALEIIGCIKGGSYRREAFWEAGFRRQSDIEAVIRELQALGLVDSRKAITMKGRNALRAARGF